MKVLHELQRRYDKESTADIYRMMELTGERMNHIS